MNTRNDNTDTRVPVKGKTPVDIEANTKAPLNKSDYKKIQSSSINDNQFLVTTDTAHRDIIMADQSGKFLVFDTFDFPEIPKSVYAQLSARARTAYTMDRRMSYNMTERMADGRSPFYDPEEHFDMKDPLARVKTGRRFTVLRPEENTKYLFPRVDEVDALIRAGYDLVKPSDSCNIPNAVEKDGKLVICNKKGDPIHACVKVSQDLYDRHLAYKGKKSKNMLGSMKREAKRRMKQHQPKVTVYDDSSF